MPPQVTERAARKLVEMAQKQGIPAKLRLLVQGGGCQGMRYKRLWIEAPRSFDHTWEVAGLQVACDPKSFNILADTTLDYETHALRGGYRWLTATAKRRCSCGESFAL